MARRRDMNRRYTFSVTVEIPDALNIGRVPHRHWRTTTFVAAVRHDVIAAPTSNVLGRAGPVER